MLLNIRVMAMDEPECRQHHRDRKDRDPGAFDKLCRQDDRQRHAQFINRRDLRHLIQLVKAIALLHFQQRQRDDSGLIIAIASDYDDAARLAAGPEADRLEKIEPGDGTISFATKSAQ